MQMYFETSEYMFLRRSLAHISYNLFCRYIWGACPPIPKSWLRYILPIPTELITFFLFFLLACQLSAGKWGRILGEDFFFLAGWGLVSSKILVPPYENPTPPPPPPPVPPYWKNPRLRDSRSWCAMRVHHLLRPLYLKILDQPLFKTTNCNQGGPDGHILSVYP